MITRMIPMVHKIPTLSTRPRIKRMTPSTIIGASRSGTFALQRDASVVSAGDETETSAAAGEVWRLG
jgi:hypothetical protein